MGRINSLKRLWKVKELAKNKNENIEIIISGKTQKELARIYNNKKYVINTGLQEGHNKAITEGVACGCIPLIDGAMKKNMEHFCLKNCEWNNVALKTKNFYTRIVK